MRATACITSAAGSRFVRMSRAPMEFGISSECAVRAEGLEASEATASAGLSTQEVSDRTNASVHERAEDVARLATALAEAVLAGEDERARAIAEKLRALDVRNTRTLLKAIP